MTEVHIESSPYGTLPTGIPVTQYRLAHPGGASVSVIEYGAIITSIVMPDRSGRLDEITAGYPSLEGYLADTAFLGAVVGRYANRIANGRFTLDGVNYELPRNSGTNHLHGGPEGFYRAYWKGRPFSDATGAGVELALHSADGDAGYPGALEARVRYHLDQNHCLSVEYEARTTKPTIVNLTQHTYFNLAGSGSILDHELRIHAERFTPIDERLIPTGVIAPVVHTALDFRDWRRIGDAIDADEPQMRLGAGYDHNFVLDGAGADLRLAAELRCYQTGRRLRVRTTEPGIQFYSGNFLPKAGERRPDSPKHGFREALCLETQHFPDSPNRPEFPSTRLDVDQLFRSRTEFAFDAGTRS
jgi:aldose 1-epimerase